MQQQQYLYKCPNHAANLNNMRLNNKWCDVTIRVNGREIHAHKLVLAANLKYFDTMLLNDSFQESKGGIITMECVEDTDLEAFITYAYTGEILLTDSNALDLLELANYLGEDGIKEACVEFLNKHLKSEEACRAYKFTTSIDCLSLKNFAKTKILMDFADCCQTGDYFSLHYEHLIDIMSHGKAQPKESQQKFFEGIMKWIMHDVNSRRVCMIDLLNTIDLAKLTADDLIGYLYGNVVDCNDEYGIIKDVMVCYQINKSQQMQRQIVSSNQALMIFGISDNSLEPAFQFFNSTTNKWTPLGTVSDFHDKAYSRSTIFNNQMYYVSDDYFEGQYLSSFSNFDPATKGNKKLLSSRNISRLSSMCSCSQFVYFCGGIDSDQSISNQVLRYDPLTNSFETLAPMKSRKWNLATIFYQGCLHVLGGWKESTVIQSRIAISSGSEESEVEKYDPNTKEWSAFPSMCMTRSCHGVAILDDKLYACGGFNCGQTAEVYDPSTNSWQLIASMNKRRWNYLVVAHQGKLLAIGGDEEKTVEVYDPIKNEWQMDQELSIGLQIKNPKGGLIPSSCIVTED